MSKFRKYYKLREAFEKAPVDNPTDAALAHDDYEDEGVNGFHRLVALLSRMREGIWKGLKRAKEWVKDWTPPTEPRYPDHDDGDYWDADASPTQADFANYAAQSLAYQDRKQPGLWNKEQSCLGPAMTAWDEFHNSCYYIFDIVSYGNAAIEKNDPREIQREKLKAAEHLTRVVNAAKAFSQAIKRQCDGKEEESRQHVLKGPLPAVVNSVVEWIMRGRLLELAQS